MRIAVLADCHIDHGIHGVWAADSFLEAVRRAVEEDCDALIVAGDLFHTGKPTTEALCCAVEGFQAAHHAGLECVMVAGNHEWIGVTRQRDRRSPAGLLDQLEFVEAPPEPLPLRLDCGLWVGAAPWPNRNDGDIDEWPDQIAWLADDADQFDGPRLLVAHVPIAEANVVTGSEVELRALTRDWTVPVTDLDLEPFDAVRAGHIHRRQMITDRVGYVGSLDRFTFTDENQTKGFSMLEWNSDTEAFEDTLIETEHAQNFATISIGDDLESIPEGALVRVTLKPGETSLDINRDEIEAAGLRFVSSRPVSDTDTEPPPTVVTGDELVSIDPAELIEEWAQREGIEGDDLFDLQDKAEDILGWRPRLG